MEGEGPEGEKGGGKVEGPGQRDSVGEVGEWERWRDQQAHTHLPVLETKGGKVEEGREARGWGRRGMEEKGRETQKTIYTRIYLQDILGFVGKA